MKFKSGTLEIVDGFNGFYLYGERLDGIVEFIAMLGDGVDAFFNAPDYDPNDDPELELAYGFETE